MMNKCELMAPVGKPEAFHAAVEAGADAIYLGLKSFSARARAVNFSPEQVQAIVKKAHAEDVKVYVALNTLIKNSELGELLDTLHLLNQMAVDAVIIQDWGVYHLSRKYFPGLTLHTSTQMGIHNSPGARHSKAMEFERAILSRELTFSELQSIRDNTEIELEVFVHGALCYSFSGACLFSSFLGGMSANRGKCTQPCRRKYRAQSDVKYIFSLKDHELIDYLPKFVDMGIEAIKIEGRMKSAEYVYRITKAYRMVLDDPSRLAKAKQLLKTDATREKTSFFMGGEEKNAISEHPVSGLFVGEIQEILPDGIRFQSNIELQQGNRIRIYSEDEKSRQAVKIKKMSIEDGFTSIYLDTADLKKGDKIYLVGQEEMKFPTKLNISDHPGLTPFLKSKKQKILAEFPERPTKQKTKLYLRIDSLKWLRKVHLSAIDVLILKFSKSDFTSLKLDAPFLQNSRSKIHMELPKFIAESELVFYQTFCKKFSEAGFRHFVLSHLSQKNLLPDGSYWTAGENLYALNDAAMQCIKAQEGKTAICPFENDMENLLRGRSRDGIVPLYFYPELFYSRVPLQLTEDTIIRDDKNLEFIIKSKDGMTIVIPNRPVSLFQSRKKLEAAGFRNFLIDLSHLPASKNVLNTLINKFKTGSQVQPSTGFNIKKGLS